MRETRRGNREGRGEGMWSDNVGDVRCNAISNIAVGQNH